MKFTKKERWELVKKDLKTLLYLVLILILIVSIMLVNMSLPVKMVEYTMPDGVKCMGTYTTGGGFGGATLNFNKCNNQKVYVNPEFYTSKEVCIDRCR